MNILLSFNEILKQVNILLPFNGVLKQLNILRSFNEFLNRLLFYSHLMEFLNRWIFYTHLMEFLNTDMYISHQFNGFLKQQNISNLMKFLNIEIYHHKFYGFIKICRKYASNLMNILIESLSIISILGNSEIFEYMRPPSSVINMF